MMNRQATNDAGEEQNAAKAVAPGLWPALKGAASDWSAHKSAKAGAAIAYYSIFSIGPLIVVVISLAGLFFGRESVQQEVTQAIRGLLGDKGSEAVNAMLTAAGAPSEGVFASIIGTVTLLFAAIGVVVQFKEALNVVWEVKPKPGGGIWGFTRSYVLSLAGVLTVGFLLLVSMLLTAGLSAIGRLAAEAMTHGRLLAPDDPRWSDVSTVITWTAIGVFLQGFYLLTSIGLNITRRTQFYPIATMTAAATNIGLNFLLIPRYGIVGAAWANGAAYAVQAALGYMFSQRFYPVPYEWGRIASVCAAATAAYVAARLLPSFHLAVNARSSLAPVPDLLMRGLTVIVVFGGLLAVTGFFHAEELRGLRSLRRRSGPAPATTHPPDSTEMAGEIVATDIGEPE
jgi:uncharacterized BrkB/YihY/UPF0761 family membrane protein